MLTRIALLTVLALSSAEGLLAPQAGETEPGLVGEYFDFAGGINMFPANPQKPILVRVEPKIAFAEVEGDFYGTKLESNFYARWTGLLRVDAPGMHEFSLASDDGSRLLIAGKPVVDNGGVHAMTEKSGRVELARGDHEIKVEFFQGGGGAGCTFQWTPPGGTKQVVPTKALWHKKGAEKIAYDEAAWKKRKSGAPAAKKGGGRYAEMDHGPFFSGTIDATWGGKNSFALKGMALRLSQEPAAAALFDSELLKLSVGWTGGYIGYPAGRDGIEGQQFADGAAKFGTKKGSLGWAKDGAFADPRAKPYGPLPADWARYRGAYVHGEKTVLAYTVGGADVLDFPAYDGADLFGRTIQAGKSASGLRMLVCEKDGAVASVQGGVALLEEADTLTAVAVSGEGATLEAAGTRIEAAIAPAGGRFKLTIWSGPKSDRAKFDAAAKSAAPADLAKLIKGGAPRNATLEVAGTLGTEPGAYQVDTIPIPAETPSKSYMRLTGLDFFADGKRAAVCTMDGDVWVISGIDATLSKLTWKRYASGLFQSLGLRIVGDAVYTLGRDQITKLHDLNADGEADFYECFNNDCGVTSGYHEFAHDLHTDAAGNFYYAKGSDMGGAKVNYHGCVVRVSPDGKKSEVWATGLRAPNGMSVGPDGTVTTSDNQGNWVPATPINWVPKQGEFCGFLPCSFMSPAPKERPPALVWIPHGLDNSGGGQVWVTSDKWGPFQGDLLHTSYGKCVMFKVLIEKTASGVQGGVVKFPLKFASGIMRSRFNPVDGQLYVAGMRGWQTDAQREGCFQRVRYTGKAANLPRSAKVTASGLDLTFTDALDKESAGNADSYVADWCQLKWTGDYGSPEFNVSDPKKRGREKLEIQGATLSADGKTVSLKIDGLQPVYYLSIRYKIKGADGTPLAQELIYTINK